MASVLPIPSPRVRPSRPLTLRVVSGGAALSALMVAIGWLVLAAAARPSVLSPPANRVGAPAEWTLGPLRGVLTSTSTVPDVLRTQALVALVVVGVAWLVVWVTGPALPLRVIWGAVVGAHAMLFFAPPLSLTDVFNYGLYGRMAAYHGLNPYRATPARAADDPLYQFSNWHHLRSPYGPLFTWANEGLALLGVQGWFWTWKVVVVLSSLGSVALAAAIAGRLGVSRQRVVACVGLSPLLLIHEVGGLHQDMVAMVFLLGAAWCMVRDRDADAPAWCPVLAGGLVVAAAGVKPSFAVVIGIVVLGAHRRSLAIAGAAVAGAALGAVVLFVFGGALPDIATQSLLVSPLSVPNLVGLAIGHGGADPIVRTSAQTLLVLLALAATVAVGLRRDRALGALAVVLFASVLALSWVMPWYLLWSLPFIALGRPRILAPLAVLATVWVVIGSLNMLPDILHWAGYYPTRLTTGRINHMNFQRLVK